MQTLLEFLEVKDMYIRQYVFALVGDMQKYQSDATKPFLQ
jgi:hypothetical protein